MKGSIKKISKMPFVRNVAIVASGTIVAQAITMGTSPIITRLYGPEAFGILGLFMAIVALLGPISALTYPVAIVLPKDESEAKGIALLSICITLTLTTISCVVLFFLGDYIIHIFNLAMVKNYIWYIPLVILFSGMLQICEQWLIRNKQFRVTAKVTFLQTAIVQSSKIGIGLINPKALTLVVLTVFSQFLKATMLMVGTRKNKILSGITYNKRNLKTLMTKYKDFPIYRAPEVFLNSASQSLPVVMLTTFFGPGAAGFYTIGRTVLSIPSQLVGKAIGDVYYPRVSEVAQNGGTTSALLKKSTLVMLGIGIVPFGTIIAFGPSLFSFVFGQGWERAGEYARWIALWSYIGFANRPSVMTLPVLRAQAFHLKYTIIMLITRILSLVIGYVLFKSDIITIALFSASGAFLNALLILLTIMKSREFDRQNK